jgi:hypothetical protein
MAKFTVLRPIEHDQVLYAPKGATNLVRTRSAGHGGEIPVDTSGIVDLDAAAAEAFSSGQVAPLAGPSAEAPPARRVKR